jgi:hypothetical protein
MKKTTTLGRSLVALGTVVLLGSIGYASSFEYHRYQIYYQLGMAKRYQQANISLPIVAADFRHNSALRGRMISEVKAYLTEQSRTDAFDITAVQYQGENWYHFNKLVIDYQIREQQEASRLTIEITPDTEETLRFCEGLVAGRKATQSGLLHAGVAN